MAQLITCYLECYDGTTYTLPTPISWQFSYGSGTPCDEFSLSTLWSSQMQTVLSKGIRLRALYDNVPLFYGVVDDFSCQWDEDGITVSLHGRGMASLLLDNEALSCDYLIATTADILQNHVTPYGIETISYTNFSGVSNFSVDYGSSQWQVLYDFACYHGGVVPRFDREGQLILGNDPTLTTLILEDGISLRSLSYQETRYGVISEVLVRDGSTQTVQQVLNEDWIAKGGQCRRVVTLSGKNSYQALRYSGTFQIESSQEEQILLTVTLGECLLATPTQLVDLAFTSPNIYGTYQVSEVELGMNSQGLYTTLTLIDP